MNVGVTSNAASVLAYRKTQTEAAQAEKKTAAALGAKDEITVSQAAKEFSKKPDSSLKMNTRILFGSIMPKSTQKI